MNKLLVALLVGAFASVVAAQTPAPAPAAPAKPTAKERQADVKSTTDAAAASTTGAQTAKEAAANTKASKETAKMTTAEKNKAIKDANKQMINPDNPSGSVAGTAAMQKDTTAASKATPKQNTELKTKEGQKELSKEPQKKATP
jgi:hypothetical protein